MRTKNALANLPATIPELAALEGVSVRAMNSTMQYLKQMGLVTKTDRKGAGSGARGPDPYIWERTGSKHSLTSTKGLS